MDTFLITVEARVRRARRGLRLADVAQAMGVSVTQAHYWEGAVRPVPREKQAKLVDVLGGTRRGLFRQAPRAVDSQR